MPKKPHQEETFRDMCFNMEKGTPVGDAGERGFNWGRKAKTSFRHTYTGNEGQACQLPLKTRKENVLKNIEGHGERGIWVKTIEPTVLDALLADGSVYLNRNNYLGAGAHGRFYTNAIASSFPQPDKKKRERRRIADQERYKQRMAETYTSEKPEVTGKPEVKKTIKWTKKRHQQLLFDVITGEADPEVIKQVTRTKTRPKKVKK